MPITPDALEDQVSLPTAVIRLDFLRRRDGEDAALNTVHDDPDDWTAIASRSTSLDVPEALELLALGEVVARKAHDSQLVGFRAALRAGAGWAEIGAALDLSPAQAWNAYHRRIERHEQQHTLDPAAAASARELAGARPS